MPTASTIRSRLMRCITLQLTPLSATTWRSSVVSTQRAPGPTPPTTAQFRCGTLAARSVRHALNEPLIRTTDTLPLRHHHGHAFCVFFLVALNFQTHCSDMDVNQGRFLVNGKSGYILKPAFMRDPRTEFDPITLTRGDWLQHKTMHIMVRLCDPSHSL